jgi:hypothetical protein
MPPGFLIGASLGGGHGLAVAWLVGFPVFTVITAIWTIRAIDLAPRHLLQALMPPSLAGLAMGLVVVLVDSLLGGVSSPLRLALLVASGGLVYGLWLICFARERLGELLALLRR